MNRTALLFLSLLLAALFLIPSEAQAQRRRRTPAKRPVSAMVTDSKLFNQAHSGFILFDPQTQKVLQQRNADKYFTPASNTKIFTLRTALHFLSDSLPVLRYLDMGDTLVFWGTGNPLFLHPDLPGDSSVLAFLRSRPETLFFTDFNFRDDHFGPGWSWADYSDYYQPERSPMPIYGNIARFSSRGADSGFVVSPALWRDSLFFGPQLEEERGAVIRRTERGNRFEFNSEARRRTGFSDDIPFDYSPQLMVKLLSDTLRRTVRLFDAAMLPAGSVNTLYMPADDALYARLMQQSDNFIAEQLLMMCSEQLFSIQNSRKMIDHAKDICFKDVPDRMEWWDGSGLSRYNFFTPRTVVHVLNQLYQQQPQERLFRIFPAGGVSGTIRGWYAGPKGEPYVFAKTGSLRYVHSLSGYVKTKKGKLLIFSFMHNNFTGSSDPLKEEMQAVLKRVYEVY